MANGPAGEPTPCEIARLREQALALAGGGVFRLSHDGVVLFMDDGAIRLFDLAERFPTPEAVIGTRFADLLSQAGPLDSLRDALRSRGEVQRFEYPFTTARGDEKWMLINGCAVTVSDQPDPVLQILALDITYPKHVEQLLRIQRDLSAALSSPSDLIGTVNRILDAAMQIEGIDCGGVYLVNRRTGDLELICNRGMSSLFVQHVMQYGPDSPAAQLMRKGSPCYWQNGEPPPVATDDAAEEGLLAAAAIPVCHEGALVAVLNVGSHTHGGIRETARNTLEAIASHVRRVVIRIQAEEDLRQSEGRYRRITETVTDYVYSVRVENGNVVATDHGAACVAVTGFTAEEFRQDPYLWIRMVPLEDHDIVRNQAAQLLAGRDAEPIQHRIARKDGAIRWVRNTPVTHYDPQGRFIGYDGLIQDITDRKEAEDALRESEQKYRTILENIGEGYYEVDLRGNFVFFNHAMCAILGYDPSEMIGMNNRVYMDEDNARRVFQIFNQVYRTGQTACVLDWELRRKDGGGCFVEVSVSLMTDPSGRPVGFRGIARDVSERLRAEQAHKAFEAQIQQAQKLESLGVLAGGIAHDFNNLLMSIMGNVDLALADVNPAAPACAYLREAETAAKRAAELCGQMLAYSGRGRFMIERINLNQVVEEMAQLLHVSISRRALLRWNLEPDLPSIEGDVTQIRQIVMNLIMNASEALGSNDGAVTLRTGSRLCDHEFLRQAYIADTLHEGRYAFIEVTDTGCGMDEATLSRIFDPFFTTKFAGRGLGLAAVLGIVRGHDGTVKVESTPGRGTVFSVFFPCRDAAPPAKYAEPSGFAGWRGVGTILIVDDEDAVRRVGKRMLEHFGFQALTADDGLHGVEVFRAHADTIRAVILDLTMPRMSGQEAFRAMRRIKPDIPVILSSGFPQEELTEDFVGEGVADFIQKPYQTAVLAQKLRRVLEGEGQK